MSIVYFIFERKKNKLCVIFFLFDYIFIELKKIQKLLENERYNEYNTSIENVNKSWGTW